MRALHARTRWPAVASIGASRRAAGAAPGPPMPIHLPALVLSILLAFAAGDAQAVYRCEVDGRVVFSDRPCPGATRIDVRPAAGGAAAAAAPAAPAPADRAPARALAPLGPGYQTREQACAEGSRRACDEIACLRDEREACERIGGGVRGSGWVEVARKRETRRGKNDRGQTTLHRVLVLTIQCSGKPPRGGDIAIGRGTIGIAGSAINFSSVDTAAAALCKR